MQKGNRLQEGDAGTRGCYPGVLRRDSRDGRENEVPHGMIASRRCERKEGMVAGGQASVWDQRKPI